MKRNAILAAAVLLTLSQKTWASTAPQSLRPPSVPLVACDPYFSIWSPSDKLTDYGTVHWTGKPHRLTALVRIDGKTFRLMGSEPASIPALEQRALEVLPTRTIYTFQGQGLRVRMTFMTPALPDDLLLYSRPVTYVTWDADEQDHKVHEIAFYLDAAGELAVNNAGDQVVCALENGAAKIGSQDQPVLAKKGDDLRIDWGYLYVAPVTNDKEAKVLVGKPEALQAAFGTGSMKSLANFAPNQAVPGKEICGAVVFDGIRVGKPTESRTMMLAYDDEFAIQYFKKNLRPYWRRNGDDAAALLKKSAAEYGALKKRCEKFDEELMAGLTKAGGEKYARLCALAYRECTAACKVAADANGQPLLFPKENFSNGCIETVDVIYPMAPQFLLFSPSLTKAMLVPILDYASSPRWRWPFAPHDLGTYPLANGQVYGGGERTERDQMPVEETGNMLVLLAALAELEGNADFCAPYWPILNKWADYLKAKGFDPENQLCTDDFAGHLAHNVNLSAKAICGLGAFGKLCLWRGEEGKGAEYMKLAKQFADLWVKSATEGDHTRLAFDRTNTWSQKYNLVWDRILGLNLFPAEVLKKEMAFYRKTQQPFGLPLDNRKTYTKLDWTLWTATLTQDPNDFAALLDPVYKFVNETPSRVPMTDWYDTVSAKQSGFQARSVVGGVFLEVLYHKQAWQKWAKRDTTRAANWAALPTQPKVTFIAPAADQHAEKWRFTTTRPGADWFKPSFDASSWSEGAGGFGSAGTPGAIIGTKWDTSDIWIRRDVELSDQNCRNLQAWLNHDEDVEVYVNGVLALRAPGYANSYEAFDFTAPGRAAFKPGTNSLAVHCHQTKGGQFVDFGLVRVESN